MEVEFDVKIDSGVLYDYMLHHTYTSFAGVVGTTVGALMLKAAFADSCRTARPTGRRTFFRSCSR